MKRRLSTTATLLALAAFSTLALADEPPGRVGRVALAQGQVSISTPGEAASSALVNWPVTSNNTISTAPGARTELRVGSTAIRLDGDSALDVVQLDDETLRLRLHYGSASVRVVNPEVAAGFELSTPQARVLLQQPGRVRVDAERVRETSSVNVFEGVAVVEGGGERLTLRAGRSAEMQGLDLRTTQALPDAFDDWVAARDRASDAVLATRYVPAEMTGYEELDRYGSWQRNSEYGDLWLPTVASDWVPYRDGRWTWIAPWGWTWVDNAPWGYAPFHYGRWVQVRHRWAWAPGRLERRPIWSPALVGWVGGAGWNLHFNSRQQPAQGWYPLAPHERYVPPYIMSQERLRRLNAHGWGDGKHDGRRDGRRDYRRQGLTVVPQDRFHQRGEVVVGREQRTTPPPAWIGAPAALPPTPVHVGRERDARIGRQAEDGRWDGRRDFQRGPVGERGRAPVAMPAPVVTAQPAPAPAPQTAAQAISQSGFVRQPGTLMTAPPSAYERDARREARETGEERDAFEDGRRRGYAPRDHGGAAVIGIPRPAPIASPAPQPVVQRGGSSGAMEAVAAAAAARAQAQAQAQARAQAHAEMTRSAPTAVAPPPQRAMPTQSPSPAPAATPPSRRFEAAPAERDGMRMRER